VLLSSNKGAIDEVAILRLDRDDGSRFRRRSVFKSHSGLF